MTLHFAVIVIQSPNGEEEAITACGGEGATTVFIDEVTCVACFTYAVQKFGARA